MELELVVDGFGNEFVFVHTVYVPDDDVEEVLSHLVRVLRCE